MGPVRRKVCQLLLKASMFVNKRICRVSARNLEPIPQLVTESHIPDKPCVPVIDAHTHLTMGPYRFGKIHQIRPRIDWEHSWLFALMDSVGVEKIIDLTPFFGENLKAVLHFHRPFSDRIVVFGSVDFSKVGSQSFHSEARRIIVEGFRHGMRGLKVFKELGLYYRDMSGKLIMPNDKRLKPIWDTCAELNIPVLIHVADPVAFFQPVDGRNERLHELLLHPEWSYHGKNLPTFEELIQAGEELIAENPHTTFIMAHVGWYAENLSWVGYILDKYQNAYVDISERIAELGRQPYSSKRFFERYQDRILFGTDMIRPTRDIHPIYYRFLETEDEYFPYSPCGGEDSQGKWRIYGIGLQESVLRKVYHDNISKLVRFDW